MATFWPTFGIILAIFILTSGHTGASLEYGLHMLNETRLLTQC